MVVICNIALWQRNKPFWSPSLSFLQEQFHQTNPPLAHLQPIVSHTSTTVPWFPYHSPTHITGNLQWSFNVQTTHTWDVDGNQSTWWKATSPPGECAHSARRALESGLNPGCWSCETAALPAAPLAAQFQLGQRTWQIPRQVLALYKYDPCLTVEGYSIYWYHWVTQQIWGKVDAQIGSEKAVHCWIKSIYSGKRVQLKSKRKSGWNCGNVTL